MKRRDQTGEQVTTGADGFGRWYARIDFPEPGYGPQHLEVQADRIRAKARRAIRRELAARQDLTPDYWVRVEVADNDLDHLDRMQSITYREVTD